MRVKCSECDFRDHGWAFGIEEGFKEEFPRAKVQRCQVHVARNVLAKVPRKLKKAVADDLRSIFYPSSREKTMGFFSQFKKR